MDKKVSEKEEDPFDDEKYKGYTIGDYMRHFLPQHEKQQAEIREINEKGSKPYYDNNYEETLPNYDPNRKITRQERRKYERLKEKLARKEGKK